MTEVNEVISLCITDKPDGPAVFNPGDVVQLKSGGPQMTVGSVVHDRVGSVWFAESGEAREALFDPATLKALAPRGADGKPEPPQILLFDTDAYDPVFGGGKAEYTLKFMVGGGPPPYPIVKVPVTKDAHEAALAMFEEARKRAESPAPGRP